MGKDRKECSLCDLGVPTGHHLIDYKVPMGHQTFEGIKYDIEEGGMDMFYIKWRDMELCCDYYNQFAFADFTRRSTARHTNSAWVLITQGFASLDEAADYPLFGGRSLRQVWDECEFFAEHN